MFWMKPSTFDFARQTIGKIAYLAVIAIGTAVLLIITTVRNMVLELCVLLDAVMPFTYWMSYLFDPYYPERHMLVARLLCSSFALGIFYRLCIFLQYMDVI